MSNQHRAQTPRSMPLTRWFDRVNRYRIAAVFLFIPFVSALVSYTFGHELNEMLPLIVRQAIYWVGLLLLTVALTLDYWEIQRGKRRVKRLIAQKLLENTTDS